ncbi:ProQ/FINO family protein [Klebsiella pneumoniae]|uniref:ProQ/FINO family protein n=1 Tax=Klebsiella pneumoniae TaxID=573 RepID=UPI000650D62A|nr:ProQ/FINO family protein [Klebsiella pneumoniae]
MTKKERKKLALSLALKKVCTRWPELWPEWKKREFRPVAPGISQLMHDQLKADPAPDLTHTEIARVMFYVTGSLSYLEQIKAGADRYGLDGQPAQEVTAEDEKYSRLRIKEIHQRIKASAARKAAEQDTTEGTNSP